MNKGLRTLCLLFGGIGLVFSLAAAGFALSTERFLERSSPVPGQVVEIQRTQPTVSQSRSVAVIEFQWEGAKRTLTTKVETNPPAYTPGQRVIIRVDPSSPDDVRIESWLEQYFLVAIFSFLGGVFLLVSFLIYRSSRRDSESPPSVRFSSDVVHPGQ